MFCYCLNKQFVIKGNNVTGVLCVKQPWPSMARTIFGDHKRFMDTYLAPYKGYYFTGDGAMRDKDGYTWILGRVDDVINVSGHRLSTAEIESALVMHHSCAEAAVVGVPDEITGQSILAFCVLKPGITADIRKELVLEVRKVIGPFAAPKRVVLVADLPKTRSGKIMRRVLRKIAAGEAEQLGDVSTLADPAVVPMLIERVAQKN
jgi:acetyl-CoA synthetase